MKSSADLEKNIEAVLFYKAEPVTLAELARLLDANHTDVSAALTRLSETLADRGIVLLENNKSYSLVTSADTSALIERLVKDELNRDLSPASLETLSIVAYKGTVTRREIEYIRGVNSSFSLRALLIRGLIERETSTLDERIFLYRPSTDLLQHLGITSIRQLPDWQSVQNELKRNEKAIMEESTE